MENKRIEIKESIISRIIYLEKRLDNYIQDYWGWDENIMISKRRTETLENILDINSQEFIIAVDLLLMDHDPLRPDKKKLKEIKKDLKQPCLRELKNRQLDPSHSRCYNCVWNENCPDPTVKTLLNKGVI